MHPLVSFVRTPLIAICLASLVGGVLTDVAVAGAWASPAELQAKSQVPDPRPELEVSVQSVSGSLARPAGDLGVTTAPRPAAWPAGGNGRVGDTPASAHAKVGGVVVGLSGEGPGVNVQVLKQKDSAVAGVAGLVVGIDRDQLLARGGHRPVTIDVDTSGFAAGIGGDWAARARLVMLPDCNPAAVVAGCAARQIEVGISGQGTRVSGSVDTSLLAGLSTSTVAFAVAAAASGPTGSFTATNLSPSANWNAGSGTGEFSWSYPITVGSAGVGPEPVLALDYNSASVDGRTSTSNNQASWVGEGFDLSTGYVERQYISCRDDKSLASGEIAPQDLCWGPERVTLMLAGHTTDLIKDSTTGQWVPLDDDGTLVLQGSGQNNGDGGPASGAGAKGEYWRITTTDGVRYYFGTQVRGTTDTQVSNSTWTVPVYGDDPGEPCNAGTFAASQCQQAWRWNLAYVVDPNGNSMSFFYDKETNIYNRNLGKTVTGGSLTSYDRGGVLTRIDYGTRAAISNGGVGEWQQSAPYSVSFTTTTRCWPAAGVTCDPTKVNTQAASWPDVPGDQFCPTTATSSSCLVYGPSFFTLRRLSKITTMVAGQQVRSWSLMQSMVDPGDGTSSKLLWLDSITQQGLGASSTASITLPPVRLYGTSMPNRVDAQLDGTPAFNRWRLTGIDTGTGASVSVSYSAQDCTPGDLPAAPETNTRRCFPVYYSPNAAPPALQYFHKYVVTQISEKDNTNTTASAKLTAYTYIGSPAWHYDDNVLIAEKYRTYGDWRGYSQVQVTVGDGTDGPVQTNLATFMRGMDGDRLPNNQTRSVVVTDTRGETLVDRAPLAGFVREQITYLDGFAEVSGHINTPWISSATGSDGSRSAYKVEVGQVDTRIGQTLVPQAGPLRKRIITSYDAAGRPVTISDEGDTADPRDDLCTTTTYAENIQTWIRNTPATTQIVAKKCGAPVSMPADLISATQTFYDNATSLNTPPVKANPTRITRAETWTGIAWTFITDTTSTYDSLGRITATTDAASRTAITTYTPAAALPVTSSTVTNPAGHASTITFDPAFGPTKITDPNNNAITGRYDALGRVVTVWGAGRATTQSPTATYAYQVDGTSTNAITTTTLVHDDLTVTSTALFDGLLRPVQTQITAPQSSGMGAVISTSQYDSRGLLTKTLGPFPIAASPSTAMVSPVALTQVPTAHVITFDGAGRPTRDQLKINDVNRWYTNTTYFGIATRVTPPAGGTSTTTVVDGRGRTRQLLQDNGSPSPDTTTYTYTPAGQLATLVDPAGNTWTYTYDVQGRLTTSTDPDKGPTTNTYDPVGNLVTSTDARGNILWRGYDNLNRNTQLREGGPTGTQLAAWTYDTATAGRGLPATSTRYNNGNAYIRAITGYTPAGQPTGTRVTIPAIEGQLSGTYTTTTTYTASGSPYTYRPVTAPGMPAGETVRYYYDNQDNPTDLETTAGAILTGVRRNPYGNILLYELGSTAGNLTHVESTYQNGTQRLTGTTVRRDVANLSYDANITYTYTNSGSLTSIRDTAAPGGGDQQCFQYDPLQRLTQAWAQPGTSSSCAATPSTAVLGGTAPYWTTYTYDRTGNRLTETRHATSGIDTTRIYAYNTANWSPTSNTGPHRLASLTQTGGAGASTSTYTYNATGQTATATTATSTTTFTWNSENQLAATNTTAAGSTNTTYLYDADGTRLFRRDTGTNPSTTLYLGDTEITLSGTTKTATRYYVFNDQTVAVRAAGTLTSIITDYHNTGTYEIDDATGNLTATRRHDPFGRSRTTTGTWAGTRGFVNGTQDPTGYTQLGARTYNPDTGRFLSLDPILDTNNPQQLNGYTYANNNPTNLADATGLLARSTFKIAKRSSRFHSTLLRTKKKLHLRLLSKPRFTQEDKEKKAKRRSSLGSNPTFWKIITSFFAPWFPQMDPTPAFHLREYDEGDGEDPFNWSMEPMDWATVQNANDRAKFLDGVTVELYIGDALQGVVKTSATNKDPAVDTSMLGASYVWKNHAEGRALAQVLGEYGPDFTGESGTLYISNWKRKSTGEWDIGPCAFCVGGLGHEFKKMGLDRVYVITPTSYEDPTPVLWGYWDSKKGKEGAWVFG